MTKVEGLLTPLPNGHIHGSPARKHSPSPAPGDLLATPAPSPPGGTAGSIVQLLTCVGGIYISFLTWALLQERITTTPYGADRRIFRAPLVVNTVQSLLASFTGYLYFRWSSRRQPSTPEKPTPTAIFPSKDVTLKLLLVAVMQSLASPFGYASLKHLDYITFLLSKSCKLLPVMFLHLTVFRRSYPFYKYAVVASVTAGVAVFTLYHPGGAGGKRHRGGGRGTNGEAKSSAWGLLLLSINLLFDGMTNSMQDHLFATAPRGSLSGPQMMTALNLLSSCLTITYLLLSPYNTELSTALAFVREHPRVMYDVLGFAACGATGQVFIFETLARFGSLVLVTVTVTRKMFSMVLSVLWFGHKLSGMQWVGVGLVFGGIGAEGEMKRRGEKAKALSKAKPKKED